MRCSDFGWIWGEWNRFVYDEDHRRHDALQHPAPDVVEPADGVAQFHADLFEGLPAGGRYNVFIGRVGPPARQRRMTRPHISVPLGATNNDELRFRLGREYEGGGGMPSRRWLYMRLVFGDTPQQRIEVHRVVSHVAVERSGSNVV
jgi:hypothetical protein